MRLSVIVPLLATPSILSTTLNRRRFTGERTCVLQMKKKTENAVARAFAFLLFYGYKFIICVLHSTWKKQNEYSHSTRKSVEEDEGGRAVVRYTRFSIANASYSYKIYAITILVHEN